MKLRIILALIILALVLGIPLAFAQNFPQVMPPNTVYGRTAIGPGPGQAIPFSALTGLLTSTLPGSCSNIGSFGGKGDNATDNVLAFNTAVLTAKCLYFPAGKYVFSAPVAWTATGRDSPTIVGDGADTTELAFSVGGGFTFNLSPLNGVHLRNFSLTTSTTGAAGGVGIHLVQQATSHTVPAYDAPSDITGVTIRGADGLNNAGSNYWSTGVLVDSISNVNWINDYFIGAFAGFGWQTNGKGVVIQGAASLGACQTFPVAHNFVASYFNLLGTGVEMGQCSQGLHFLSDNFTGGAYGIHVPPAVVGLTELSVVGSQFNNSVSGVRVESITPNLTLSGNTFYMATDGSIGAALQAGGGGYSVVGNIFNFVIPPPGGSPMGLNGLAIAETGNWRSVVSGNVFFNSSPTPFGTGLFMESGEAGAVVTGNTFSNLTAPVVANVPNNNVMSGNFPEATYTIASLPGVTTATNGVCDTTLTGSTVKLADTTAAAAPVYGAAVVGGGSTSVVSSVMCNGANWTYH